MQVPIRRHTVSFAHAWDGIWHTVRTQPNFKIHLTVACMVIVAGIYFQLTHLEWIIIVFTILWVLVSEMINTSIEAMVDLLTMEIREKARIAKDVAAGMVLVGAFGAVIVGVIIFGPKLLALIS